MLNKSILQVAAKYVDSDLSGCLLQFLALGTKVLFISLLLSGMLHLLTLMRLRFVRQAHGVESI